MLLSSNCLHRCLHLYSPSPILEGRCKLVTRTRSRKLRSIISLTLNVHCRVSSRLSPRLLHVLWTLPGLLKNRLLRSRSRGYNWCSTITVLASRAPAFLSLQCGLCSFLDESIENQYYSSCEREGLLINSRLLLLLSILLSLLSLLQLPNRDTNHSLERIHRIVACVMQVPANDFQFSEDTAEVSRVDVSFE